MSLIPSLELAKLTIFVEQEQQPFKPFTVLFNPNQIEIGITGWKEDSKTGLVPADDPKTLSVTLFFDTSLPQAPGGLGQTIAQATLGRSIGLSGLKNAVSPPTDVRTYTQQITQLTEPQVRWKNGRRPPVCQLQWGKWGGSRPNEGFFQGVLKSVQQTFSRFAADGTPLRAQLVCSFEEWEDPTHRRKKLNPVDDPVRIVKRGETLSSIAQEEYGDPSLWRVIAAENRLTNPRILSPGQALTVPPLRPQSPNRRSR
ncbi:LysM peptidoglycan-binding domain-containing protein [Leptolyngbya sp. AN02str]|uniref:CIS tube protein n=1 Tax=Leptolyngbya sp. AN02str TaxID=3423363 RepID=UPI003D31D13C